MRSKSLLLVCFVMLSTISVFAQSSATDAISGTLQGLPSPGEIKSGTFDPQTGALKLEAAPTDGSALRLILEGTVVLGTVTGRVSGDNQTGTFKITEKVAATAASAPPSGAAEAAAVKKNVTLRKPKKGA